MTPEVNHELFLAIVEVEEAVDAREDLTRKSSGGFTYEAEIVFQRGGVWEVRCPIRGKFAKGRGAKALTDAKAGGLTPQAAVAKFIADLDIWSQVLNK